MANENINPDWQDEIEEDDEQDEKKIALELTVDAGQEATRIDKFIMMRMVGVTRTKVQDAIEKEMVLVNDNAVKANYKVRPLDHIIVYSSKPTHSNEIIPEDIALDIVYEDEDVLVINKPYNMVVHPGHGNWTGTVLNAVAFHFQKNNLNAALPPRLGMVHRIDKDTSGLLVLGKTEQACSHLGKQFFDHTVKRLYNALVWGDVEDEQGTIDTYIARHERERKIFTVYDASDEKGKHAITHYKILERFNYVTLIECRLETGRTHQIRVHMKHLKHTLFNDKMYGGDKILKGTVYAKYKQFVDNCFTILPRQALHAKTLGFIHPTTQKEMLFEVPLAKDMELVIEKWRTYVKAKKILEE
ncbi:MAG: RluA family pseudouridine synthase [Chitinophagaceae bacterium]